MAERPSSTHLVVDGSNIATEGRSLPSLQQLDEAVRALITEQPHDTWTVVVDATFGHRIESAEKQMYEEALAANELVTPPAGTIGRGDKFLLEIADRANATVFSNDSFQEFHGEYEWLFDEGRLIGGKPVPEVGWIFTARTPVRGPKSRMSSRAASERRGRASGSRGSRRVLSATEPLPVPSKPPPRTSRREPLSAASVAASAAPAPEIDNEVAVASTRSGRGSRVRRSSTSSVEAVNEPLPFIEFIAENGPGSVVKGEVTTFTSHGAFVQVGDVRCYLALKLMGDPAPRSARDVLNRGEVYDFVVHALDAPRRGIDLAMPAAGQVAPKTPAVAEALPAEKLRGDQPRADQPRADQPRRARRIRQAPSATEEVDVAEAPVVVPEAPRRRRVRKAVPEVERYDETPSVAKPESAEEPTQKATPKKAATKKAATKKVTAKKAAPVKKAATKKAVTKTAATNKAATKKVTAKKSATTKASTTKAAATKKAATKKAAVKKVSAKKSAATKKAAVKKAPARKRIAARDEGSLEAAGGGESL